MAEQLDICAWLMIAFAIVTAVCLQFTTAAYGRYSPASSGFAVPCQVAWVLQESPSFLVPFVLLFSNYRHQHYFTPNVVLLAMFLLHYFRR